MLVRYMLLGIITAFLLTGLVFAEGIVYGEITYNDCGCCDGAYADVVKIEPTKFHGDPYDGYVTCDEGHDSFIAKDVPAGWYKAWIEFGQQSECEGSNEVYFYHDGGSTEVVGLQAYGH